MKIATFNINNVNKRLESLLGWLAAARPDVVCLQELKATQAAFPESAIRDAGYEAVWVGEKSWNGVAILARDAQPILTRANLPGDPADTQSRYVEAAVNGVLIASLYLPNGNPQPGPKFDYKLAWFERLIAHAGELMAAGVPVCLAGDYNVVPTELDIYPSRSYATNALVQPQPRAAFRRLLDQGWTDAIRAPALGRAHLQLLGLHAAAVRTRRRPAAGPPAAQSRVGPPADWRGRSTRRCGATRSPAITRLPGSNWIAERRSTRQLRSAGRFGRRAEPRQGHADQAHSPREMAQARPVTAVRGSLAAPS